MGVASRDVTARRAWWAVIEKLWPVVLALVNLRLLLRVLGGSTPSPTLFLVLIQKIQAHLMRNEMYEQLPVTPPVSLFLVRRTAPRTARDLLN